MLDTRTLMLTLIAILFVTGAIQLVSARSGREEARLPYWGLANLTAGLGIVAIGLIAHRPTPLVVNLSFATILLGYSLNWAGMRRFCRRPAPAAAILAPPVAWLILVQLPLFHSPEWRIAASAVMTCIWCLATAWTLWRYTDEELFARIPTVAWLTFYGLFMAARVPLALSQSFPDGASALASLTMTMGLFAAVIHVVLISFLQLALAKGRADNRYRKAAETDMLTGIANRRAFFDRAGPMVEAALREGRPAAVLVIDIDRFKAINDNLGHAGGDAVIVAVAHAIRDSLRPGDVCGRLGGEEFGCILPGTPLHAATGLAEALRARIASLGLNFEGTAVKVSASIGIAVTGAGTDTIDRLIAEADAGLYQAKRTGRDRVVAMDVAFVD